MCWREGIIIKLGLQRCTDCTFDDRFPMMAGKVTLLESQSSVWNIMFQMMNESAFWEWNECSSHLLRQLFKLRSLWRKERPQRQKDWMKKILSNLKVRIIASRRCKKMLLFSKKHHWKLMALLLSAPCWTDEISHEQDMEDHSQTEHF